MLVAPARAACSRARPPTARVAAPGRAAAPGLASLLGALLASSPDIGLGRAGARRRRGFLADRLTVVVADHHDDEVRFLGRDDLARHLRPFKVAPLVVADQAGIGAMLADDADLRFFREGIFKPVGQPVRVPSPITTMEVVASGFFCAGGGARE